MKGSTRMKTHINSAITLAALVICCQVTAFAQRQTANGGQPMPKTTITNPPVKPANSTNISGGPDRAAAVKLLPDLVIAEFSDCSGGKGPASGPPSSPDEA